MKSRTIKYAIAGVVVWFVLYNSVYFEKLSEVQAASSEKTFDASGYAQGFWNNSLLPSLPEAVELSELIHQLKTNPEQAFEEHSHALGIGNIRYFLVQGQGEVTSVNENDVRVLNEMDTSRFLVQLETEFVYGNAVRDAVGTINISEFTNTMHLNQVSEEINRMIRQEVIPPFRNQASEGDKVQFVGAVELNQKYLNLDEVEIIPVSLVIMEQ